MSRLKIYNGTTWDYVSAPDVTTVTTDSVQELTNKTIIGGDSLGVGNYSLDTSTGELGAGWESWTPTFTNITLGTSTPSGKTKLIGKTMFFFATIALSATSSITGDVSVSLPSQSSATNVGFMTCLFYDASAAQLKGNTFTSISSNATSNIVRAMVISGTDLVTATVTSAVPFSFATSDIIAIRGYYEIA